MNRTLKPITIVGSYIIFLVGWCLYERSGGFAFSNEYLNWALGLAVHILWWPAFAIFMIGRYRNDLPITLREMTVTLPKAKILLPLLALAGIYNYICWRAAPESFGNKMKAYDLIVTILTVGFFEEIVFRGWFQNAIGKFCSERVANFIAALMFTFIHYPGWISRGYSVPDLLFRSVQLVILGMVFGWVFRKNRSIWAGTILHSVWDAIVFLL